MFFVTVLSLCFFSANSAAKALLINQELGRVLNWELQVVSMDVTVLVVLCTCCDGVMTG